ncbi:lytic transglycosylase domain-containing protein [Streptomyces flavofungini]|uniref:Lytic transglycosylase domain-containing protein n=1 Tax=Streptomyces flavofungini TaxID=68200 RepID=A0ABS0X307_9ACTN|nr:lytic transglycosylase domain-containing protein [Streptomyces flavofungini]MBJ3807570.1 lytic transglycosylase domain-containing protein [Streptomyces flavofungini]GHC64754.1 lytic transglycosylase [Streptomyces flavofungini]
MAAVFGSRVRRTAVTTAVAAAAVAALAASQAPGVTNDQARDDRAGAADTSPSPDGDSATGDSPYYTDLPPLHSPVPPSSKPGGGVAIGDKEAGLPATVLDAYKKAEAAVRTSRPGCNLPWQLLAAIGKVESGQARGGRVDADGTTLTPILGPVLDGNGFAKITDTDRGAFDGDTTHDRAVGPMQFIPSTWASWQQDGNADGKKDPNNIYDAALGAAHYLCAGGRDLADKDDLHAAILSYNRSTEYLNTVLSWLEYYRKGTHEVPDGSGVLPDDRSDESRPTPGPSTRPVRPTPPATTPPKQLPKPHEPGKTPGGDSKPPGKPGGGSETPKPPKPGGDPGTPKPPKPPKPSPSEQVSRLKNAGAAELTATAGDAFAGRVAAKAENRNGIGVPKVKVRFTVSGDTDTRFEGGARSVTVTTSGTGTATAPVVEAGEQTGEFTVRARVVDRSLTAVEVPATVTARQADALVRTSDKALTCEPGKAFADQVEVKATYKGESAEGVAATATMIKSAQDSTANDKGPYFKDADGKPVRTLKGLKTDEDGKLLLPKMYADDTAGTYLLRIVTNGGATLTVELKVAAPAA